MGNRQLATLLMAGVTLIGTANLAPGQQYRILHGFNGITGQGGYDPYGGVVFDAAGNLYGTTHQGGAFNYGTVYKLSPKTSGGWTEEVLHSFDNNGTDGCNPYAGVIIDASGNLYGMTPIGGAYNEGVVFELSPGTGGIWSEKILLTFGSAGVNSAIPEGGLITDAFGNLYATSLLGGAGSGTVFELSPSLGGGWTWTLLHSFGDASQHDGLEPYDTLTSDGIGNLYGTTYAGGVYSNCFNGTSCGTVFELKPAGNGSWTETLIHSFANRTDGADPWAGLVRDALGKLYGTTVYGGNDSLCQGAPWTTGCGVVFELSPTADGDWTETVVHTFTGSGKDGAFPYDGITMDSAGNLYGTTLGNSVQKLYGTVFELSPQPNGTWYWRTLHDFSTNSNSGYLPSSGLILDAHGNLYGTAQGGGSNFGGVVFEITP